MKDAPEPLARSGRGGWVRGLAWAGGGAVLAVAGLWFFRIPIADLWLRSAMSARGLEADFQVLRLDLGGARIADMRIGLAPNPDAEAARVDLAWRWAGLAPRLTLIRLSEPALRLELGRDGGLSAGSLSRLGTRGEGPRPQLPELELVIEDGRALIEAPFGTLSVSLIASGTLGEDFTARALLAPVSLPGAEYGLEAGQAELLLDAAADGVALRLTGSARRLIWDGVEIGAIDLSGAGAAPLDLSRAEFSAAVTAVQLSAPEVLAARRAAVSADFAADLAATGLVARAWTASAKFSAPSVTWGDKLFTLTDAEAGAEIEGDAEGGRGAWRMIAQGLRGEDFAAARSSVEGIIGFNLSGETSLTASGRILLREARLDADARARLRRDIPNLSGAPPGPLFAEAERALDAALQRFDLAAPLTLQWNGRAGRIVAEAPIEARAHSGALLRVAPLREDAPAFTMHLPAASVHGATALELSGAGLPSASLMLDAVDWAPNGPIEAEGTLAITDWRAAGARASSEEMAVNVATAAAGGGRVTLVGPASLSGPLGDGRIENLETALDLIVSWGEGWRAAPAHGCMAARIGALAAAGLNFRRGALSLCPAANGAFIAGDANGRLSGGFVVRGLALNGVMAGPEASPARLSAASVTGAFGGTQEDVALDVVADAARLSVALSPSRTMNVRSARVTARALFGNQTWRVEGGFEGGALDDPSLPGQVTAIAGAWRAAPENDRAVITVSAAAARLTASANAAADARAAFNPIRLADVEAVLRDGQVDMQGAIRLENPESGLARFTAHHDVESGVGHAVAEAETLTFNPALQPFQISELARGVIANVRGRASGTAELNWTPDALTGRGRLRLDGLSFATASVPVIENVVGEIVFDDLFALTTPPGQSVRVGLVNPGIAVSDGEIRFQLLPQERVSIEDARWPFAGGTLAVAPTTLILGAEETRLRVTLSGVDAALLLAQLKAPDLLATGTVEGSFPLLLTQRSAFIEDGVLTAAPGGGEISYVGNAGDGAVGAARIAFDALSRFRYDALELRLSGDLSGDVISTIRFSGHNVGESVNLSSVSSGGSLTGVSVRNAPFRFNVTLTAPFRRLADTAAGIGDARVLLDQAGQTAPVEEQADEVDQTAPAPR